MSNKGHQFLNPLAPSDMKPAVVSEKDEPAQKKVININPKSENKKTRVNVMRIWDEKWGWTIQLSGAFGRDGKKPQAIQIPVGDAIHLGRVLMDKQLTDFN